MAFPKLKSSFISCLCNIVNNPIEQISLGSNIKVHVAICIMKGYQILPVALS